MIKKILNSPQVYIAVSKFQVLEIQPISLSLWNAILNSMSAQFQAFLHSWEETFINSTFWIPLYREGFETKKKKMLHVPAVFAVLWLWLWPCTTSPVSFCLISFTIIPTAIRAACLSLFIVFKGNSTWSVQCGKAQSFQKRLSRAFKILIQMHCNAISFHLSPSRFLFMMDKQSHSLSLQEGV